jgi:thiol-disulfide isomerase/thioredoxin
MRQIVSHLICLALLAVGCGQPDQATSDDSEKGEPVASAKSDGSREGANSPAPPGEDPEWARDSASSTKDDGSAGELPPVEITVETVNEAGFATKLSELGGKVVLVDFWATWCFPCRKSFPHTVELARNHADRGLAVISVALDEEIAAGEIQKFLEQQRADLINLRSAYGSDELSFEKFELGTTGIPYYKLYARDGSLVKSFSIPDDGDAIDFDEIAAAVEAELAK